MLFLKRKSKGETVAVVGSGISGLMDAFALREHGFDVSVYTKGPDPRRQKKTEHFSSTHNGELGRFISRFEGEHYLGDSPMYPDMFNAFKTHVTQGGWLGKYKHEWDAFDKAWLEKRWGACQEQKQMKKTERWYVAANGKAMHLWQKYVQQFPALFHNTDMLNTGILRLYDTPPLFAWAVKRHKKEKVLENALSQKGVAETYPYFAEACENGIVAGGVEAPGFSFNIHAFTHNLITHLEIQGVAFHWETEIEKIQCSSKGLVEGLLLKNGELITKIHYTINTGAYAEETFYTETPAAEKIAGVAGRWMFLPSPRGFSRPVKIHGDARQEDEKRFPVVDVNLTHCTDDAGDEWLAVGGGYAYLGKPPFEKTNTAFDAIDAENERTVHLYLGPTYRAAKKKGLLRKSAATCIRSFTHDDMPIMETMKTTGGGALRFNIGTNTGTTTISPFTALQTVRSLQK